MSTESSEKRSSDKHAQVIAHGDLDGLASAAVIVNALLNEGWSVKISIAAPHTLYRALQSLEAVGANLGVIVDIALDDAVWSQIKEKLASLTSKGVSILWVDHHKSTGERAEEILSLNVDLVWAPELSVAPIVRKMFLDRTDDKVFFSKLLLLGEAGDRAARIERGSYLFEVLEAVSLALDLDPLDEAFRVRLVRMWASRKVLVDDEVALRSEEAYEFFAKLLNRSKERLACVTDKAVVIDMVGVRMRGFAGRLAAYTAEGTGKVCFILLRAGLNELVVTCRVPKSLNVNAHEIARKIAAKFGGSGGGHEKAASVRVPLHLKDAVLGYLRELCRKL